MGVQGERTLHELAGEGDVEGLRRMLQQGTPVDARDDAGCTALHFAADRGAVEAARVLVEAGADLGARDDEGQTPLHYAAITEQREVGPGGKRGPCVADYVYLDHRRRCAAEKECSVTCSCGAAAVWRTATEVRYEREPVGTTFACSILAACLHHGLLGFTCCLPGCINVRLLARPRAIWYAPS